MKSKLFASMMLVFCILIMISTSGCCSYNATDYTEISNWLVLDAAPATTQQTFDVFYLHPTLTLSQPYHIINWNSREANQIAAKQVQEQNMPFKGITRLYVPKVHQLDSKSIKAILNNPNIPWEKTELKWAIQDLQNAFDYYLKNFNNGRPYILFAQGQGAMEMLCMLKARNDIKVEQGFVAAYLIDLPNANFEQLTQALMPKKIALAQDANSTGVFITWNAMRPGVDMPVVAKKGNYAINPLNWRIDDVPASAKENMGSYIRDPKTGIGEWKYFLCGARLDPARGTLLLDLPANSVYDQYGAHGKGVFYNMGTWLFLANLKENAQNRVQNWYKAMNENKK